MSPSRAILPLESPAGRRIQSIEPPCVLLSRLTHSLQLAGSTARPKPHRSARVSSAEAATRECMCFILDSRSPEIDTRLGGPCRDPLWRSGPDVWRNAQHAQGCARFLFFIFLLTAADLMAENHALRGLIKGLSGFIGDGTGGVLTRMGWDQSDFEAFVSRSETDTVWEGYQQRKKNADHAAVAEQRTSTSASSKRPLETDSSTSRTANKKARADPSDHDPSSFPLLSSLPSMGTSAPLFPPAARSQERNGIFSEIMQAASNPTMFMQSPSNSSSSPYPSSGTPVMDTTYPSSYIPIDSASFDNANSMVSQQRLQQPTDIGELLDDDDDPKKMEAYKLIQCVEFQMDDLVTDCDQLPPRKL